MAFELKTKLYGMQPIAVRLWFDKPISLLVIAHVNLFILRPFSSESCKALY